MNEITLQNGLTLPDLANNPSAYPAEVKAAGLEVIKAMKQQLRDMESSISLNVISEMKEDNATKIIFINSRGEDKTLTLKSAPKKLNPNIKDFEQYAIENGFPNLLETVIVPVKWSVAKELRKQGSSIQKVIDSIYVDATPSIEIK